LILLNLLLIGLILVIVLGPACNRRSKPRGES
jgi:hypothetical protein